MIREAVRKTFAGLGAEVDHQIETGNKRSGEPVRGFWTPTKRRTKHPPSRGDVTYNAVEDRREELFRIVREEIHRLRTGDPTGGARSP